MLFGKGSLMLVLSISTLDVTQSVRHKGTNQPAFCFISLPLTLIQSRVLWARNVDYDMALRGPCHNQHFFKDVYMFCHQMAVQDVFDK